MAPLAGFEPAYSTLGSSTPSVGAQRLVSVREAGFEPAPITERVLSAPRLPIPPFPLIAILLLSACALQPPVVEQRTTTVQVKVPVAVPCFTEAERPVLAPPTPVAEGATADQMAAALRADIENEKLFANAVDAIFLKCLAVGSITIPK